MRKCPICGEDEMEYEEVFRFWYCLVCDSTIDEE